MEFWDKSEKACSPKDGCSILTFSARTTSDLERITERFAEFLERHPEISLGDAAYTLQTGRKQFRYRKSVVSTNAKIAADILHSDKIFTDVCRDINEIVFLFPDYGNCYNDHMCRGLYDEEPLFRHEMDGCLNEYKNVTGYEASGLDPLTHTFIVQYALAKFLIQCGIIPVHFTADGTGKYVAACLAGTVSLKEALLLVSESIRTGENSMIDKAIGTEDSEYWYKGSFNQAGTVFVEIGTGAYFQSVGVRYTNNGTGIAVNVIRPEKEEESDSEFFLEQLGLLWCSGVKIDWKQYNSGRNRKHISLPAYPFQGQSYPIDGLGFKKAACMREEPYKSHKEPDMDKWFYAPTWRTAGLPDGMPLERAEIQTWLLLMDMNAIGSILAERLKEKGQEVLIVKPGTGFEKM